jgi:hypothetical protein
LVSDNEALNRVYDLLAMDLTLAMSKPSPYIDHPPEVWAAYQRRCNARLKLYLQLKRKDRKPPKPFPLP